MKLIFLFLFFIFINTVDHNKFKTCNDIGFCRRNRFNHDKCDVLLLYLVSYSISFNKIKR